MRTTMRGTSPIIVTAALSVAALIAALGAQLGSTSVRAASGPIEPRDPIEAPQYVPIEDADGNGTPDWQDALAKSGVVLSNATATDSASSSTDPITNIAANIASSLYGGYLSLKQYNEYSPSRASELGMSVAETMRAPNIFVPHTVQELKLSSDTSEKNVLAYRMAMRDATAPMVTDDPPEFELFARYSATKDVSWLAEIGKAAARYRAVEANMLGIDVPQDAAPEHLRALNAVGNLASTLERLAQYGTDTFASVALVQSENDNEKEMLLSFDALAKYYVRKVSN